MVPHLEKPRITEIQVRMDCNGCVQKIKKALHGINGIYDMCIDFRQQKLTLVGWADPERVIKAIKKTRKIATICSHAVAEDPQPQPTEPPAESGPPAPPPPEATNPAASEAPPAEPAKPEEPAKEPPPPQPENPPPEVAPSPVATETSADQSAIPPAPKDVETVHIIHHHHHNDYTYDDHWKSYSSNYRPWHEHQHSVTHSYNNYRPSVSVTRYVAEYEYPQSVPHYVDEQHSRRHGGGDNITSMFSDENPNACTIV